MYSTLSASHPSLPFSCTYIYYLLQYIYYLLKYIFYLLQYIYYLLQYIYYLLQYIYYSLKYIYYLLQTSCTYPPLHFPAEQERLVSSVSGGEQQATPHPRGRKRGRRAVSPLPSYQMESPVCTTVSWIRKT